MTKPFNSFLVAIMILSPASLMAEESAKVVATDTVVAQAEKMTDDIITPIIAPSDAPVAVPSMVEPALEIVSDPTAVGTTAPLEVTAPLDTMPSSVIEAPALIAEAIPTDNLEFISGEISSTDETTQSVVVKLYGETETGTSDKTLKVIVDGTTDITDGEQDRDLKSLTAGTEVDVEYDPATNKATYIFVY